MARIRRYIRALILSFGLLAPSAAPALAQQSSKKTDLFDRPVLTVDAGRHTGMIRSQAVDREGKYAVTGGDDRTLRVWALKDGRLVNTIFVPAGPDYVGDIFAVAVSPDGALIAAGGWTEQRLQFSGHSIYLFDRLAGKLLRRIGAELPDFTAFLTFSPDGRFLAALVGRERLHVFDREADWREVFHDTCPDDLYGAAFSADGRLATTCYDGKIRLYAYDAKAANPGFRPVHKPVETSGGRRPFRIAFSPDGALLAVGYKNIAGVDLLSARTLELRRALRPQGVAAVAFGTSDVAWSRDGKTLFAVGGVVDAQDRRLLFAWDHGGEGEERRMTYCAADTATGLDALPNGSLLVAGATPCLGRLDAEGRPIWTIEPSILDFRNQANVLRLSPDGKIVDFGYYGQEKVTLRFDITALHLSSTPLDAGETLPPKQEGLKIDIGGYGKRPTLDGKLLPSFEYYQMARSLALAADARHFFIGSFDALAAFNAAGAVQWRQPSRGEIWAVNASADGRLVVTADGGGALRWRGAADGRELLALQVIPNHKEPAQWDWVLWTPEGFYAATPGAENVLKWVVNHGPDQAATTWPVSAIPRFHRPDALKLVLDELETARALGIGDISLARCDVQSQTGSAKPPGAVLRVLAIGIDRFGESAGSLHLDYAGADARDVATVLLDSQRKPSCGPSLYADVATSSLSD